MNDSIVTSLSGALSWRVQNMLVSNSITARQMFYVKLLILFGLLYILIYLPCVCVCFQHGLTLIPVWINNHTPSKEWDETADPFPNFNGCTVEVWELISNFIPHLWTYGCNYLSMLGLKLIHINEMAQYAIYPCWDKNGSMLTHWGRATHICVSKLTIIASDNGLSPGRRQAII